MIERHDCTTQEIQEKILVIAKRIDALCKEACIPYYLMGGTALGAMRHGGFIPWDDDFDVFMTPESFARFAAAFEVSKPRGLFLQRGGTEEWPLQMSRVCLEGTTFISEEFKRNMKQHHNIFVDIMMLYSVPDEPIARRAQYLCAQALRVSALSKMDFKSSGMKNAALNVAGAVVKQPVERVLTEKLVQYEGVNTKSVGHYFGRARFAQAIFPREFVGEPRHVSFEDASFPVFEHVEEYLAMRYGSKWMDMPSKEVRDSYPIHGDYVDLEHDYTHYLSADGNGWIF